MRMDAKVTCGGPVLKMNVDSVSNFRFDRWTKKPRPFWYMYLFSEGAVRIATINSFPVHAAYSISTIFSFLSEFPGKYCVAWNV